MNKLFIIKTISIQATYFNQKQPLTNAKSILINVHSPLPDQ